MRQSFSGRRKICGQMGAGWEGAGGKELKTRTGGGGSGDGRNRPWGWMLQWKELPEPDRRKRQGQSGCWGRGGNCSRAGSSCRGSQASHGSCQKIGAVSMFWLFSSSARHFLFLGPPARSIRARQRHNAGSQGQHPPAVCRLTEVTWGRPGEEQTGGRPWYVGGKAARPILEVPLLCLANFLPLHCFASPRSAPILSEPCFPGEWQEAAATRRGTVKFPISYPTARSLPRRLSDG